MKPRQALAALNEIAETAARPVPEEAAEKVLECLFSLVVAKRGRVSLTEPQGREGRILAEKEISARGLFRKDSYSLRASAPGGGVVIDVTVEGAPPEGKELETINRFLNVAVTAVTACVHDAAGRISLGQALQRHITAWIEPMSRLHPLRSDLFSRLVGEVEKVVIMAALEKTGHVQSKAALFLGINRNTISKKIRQYGLKTDEQ